MLDNVTFYAVMVVEGANGWREVDARSSDALNLALILDAPVVVDAEIMASAQEKQGSPEARSQLYAEGTVGAAEIAQAMVSHWNDTPRTTPDEPRSSTVP